MELNKISGYEGDVADEKKLKPWLDGERYQIDGYPEAPYPGRIRQEGKFAESNNFWMPYTTNQPDFFLNTSQMRHLDFAKPEVTAWYFDQLKGALDSGISGWWNDEVDSSEATDDGNETEGFDMQRAVYEWQRSYAPKQRVWSINRNFYLGAQRYAYGLWSGDIDNGFGAWPSSARNAECYQCRRHAMDHGYGRISQWTRNRAGGQDRK